MKAQILLCALISDEDDEILPDLCVTDKFIIDLIQRLGSCKDLHNLIVTLNKIKCVAKLSNNRVILRKFKVLPALQKLSEIHAGSSAEGIAADIICILLSDPQDDVEEDNPLATFEAFMMACFEGIYRKLLHAIDKNTLAMYLLVLKHLQYGKFWHSTKVTILLGQF